MLIASVAGWLVEGPVREMLGPVSSTAASAVAGGVVFFFAKRFVSGVRGHS